MNEFEENMKKTKNIPFNKTQVIVKKDTLDSMNKVIKESKNALKLQPKINDLFKQITEFTRSHQTLEKENKNMEKQMKSLKARNQNLIQENNRLKSYLEAILKVIKGFFRKILQFGNEKTKDITTHEIKEYYYNDDFNQSDIYYIAKDTTKENELFVYADIDNTNDIYIDNDDYDIEL